MSFILSEILRNSKCNNRFFFDPPVDVCLASLVMNKKINFVFKQKWKVHKKFSFRKLACFLKSALKTKIIKNFLFYSRHNGISLRLQQSSNQKKVCFVSFIPPHKFFNAKKRKNKKNRRRTKHYSVWVMGI